MSKYKQLKEQDRYTIERMLRQGYNISDIARTLGRDKSTISRELKRNRSGRKYYYQSHIAQDKANKRLICSHRKYALKTPLLKQQVTELLQTGLSPQRIAQRLRIEGQGDISHTAIYQWIKREQPALEAYLYRSYHKPKYKTKARVNLIPGRVPVARRPIGRLSGQWESDLIVSSKCRKHALQTCVERKSRYLLITPLLDKTALTNKSALIEALKDLPCSSITYDNGIENILHREVNQVLGCKSYFCEPYHSWEKGTVENRNGIIRQYLPKQTDFRQVPPELIRKIQDSINYTPMKCLGYLTPYEVQFNVRISLEQIKQKVFSPKILHRLS